MMSDHLPDVTVCSGRAARGKPPLPVEADAEQLVSVLRRAMHTVECRELGSEAAQQRFGLLADTTHSRVTVYVDDEQLRSRFPGRSEAHQLARAVRERGPAADVVLVSLRPAILVMDEMAHVVRRIAESSSGAVWAGIAAQGYGIARAQRMVRWLPRDGREVTDEL
ncbi:hypothetical protein [Streptomyces sp. NPDC059611]|uniref:hypothetical protein n=1 Tax=Streptomyces sp. NPDC059611 TaxID=3346884 RepID=UPI0036958892